MEIGSPLLPVARRARHLPDPKLRVTARSICTQRTSSLTSGNMTWPTAISILVLAAHSVRVSGAARPTDVAASAKAARNSLTRCPRHTVCARLTSCVGGSSLPRCHARSTRLAFKWHGSYQRVSRLQAARDLSCDAGIAVRDGPLGSAVATEGCGRRVVYARVVCSDSHQYPKAPYGVWPGTLAEVAMYGAFTFTERLVPISQPAGPAWTYGSEHFSGAEVIEAASSLARINAQAAHDLGCPRDQVVPGLVHGGRRAPDTPIAEGCGQRATYLATKVLRLSAIVQIMR